MAILNYRDPADQQWKTLDGPTGPTGATGPVGAPGPTVVSADAGNTATLGTDGLPFVPGVDTTQMDLDYVNLTGDTMTGELTLPDQVTVPPPVVPEAVAARGYVDQVITVSDVDPAGVPVRDGLIWAVLGASPLVPPTNFAGTYVDATTNTVTWVDSVDPTATGYEIYYSLVSFTRTTENDTLLGTVLPGVQTFTHTKDDAAQATGTVFYGIRAVNADNVSELVQVSVDKIGPTLPPWGGTNWEQRPIDWLPSTVVPGEQKIAMLVHVLDVSAQIASLYTTVTGAAGYTVDWGDGSAPQDFASGVMAEHEYEFATMASTGATAFKQAWCIVTPQAGGEFATLSAARLPRERLLPDQWFPAPAIVEIIVGPGTLTRFDSKAHDSGEINSFEGSEHVDFLTGITPTTCQNMFAYGEKLRAVTGDLNTSAVTNFTFMFERCIALPDLPVFDTSSGTDFFWTFAYLNVSTMPLFDFSSGTRFSSTFNGCTKLTAVPLFNTSNGVDFGSMFAACEALTTIPLIDTSNGTMFGGMFHGCAALTSIPALDFSKGTYFTNVFNACLACTSIDAFGIGSDVELSDAGGDWGALPMDEAAINTFFRNLASSTDPNFDPTWHTVTVSGCPGSASCDKTIATAKGWTVT